MITEGEFDVVLMYNTLAKVAKEDAETFQRLVSKECHPALAFNSLTKPDIEGKENKDNLIADLVSDHRQEAFVSLDCQRGI